MITAVALGAMALIGVTYLIVRPLMIESCVNDYCSVSKTYNNLMNVVKEAEIAADIPGIGPVMPNQKPAPKQTVLKQREVRWKKSANYEA